MHAPRSPPYVSVIFAQESNIYLSLFLCSFTVLEFVDKYSRLYSVFYFVKTLHNKYETVRINIIKDDKKITSFLGEFLGFVFKTL